MSLLQFPFYVNDAEKKTLLKLQHDFFHSAGSESIQEVTTLTQKAMTDLGQSGLTVDNILQMYNLRVRREPVEVEARVLPEPILKFAGGRAASINNGSWNLARVEFSKPADINSLAVVDLTGRAETTERFMKKFLDVASGHGMKVPRNLDLSRLIVSTQENIRMEDIQGVIIRAIQNAVGAFLHDSTGRYKHNNVWFQSKVQNPDKTGFSNCLVMTSPTESGLVGVILEQDVSDPTHKVGNELVRIMVKVKETDTHIDPFDFRYGEYFFARWS